MPLTRGMLVMLRIIIFWKPNTKSALVRGLLQCLKCRQYYRCFCEILVDLVHKNTAIEKTATQYTLLPDFNRIGSLRRNGSYD